MRLEIDPLVRFSFHGGREFKVDVLDLQDFVDKFFADNSKEEANEKGETVKFIADWKVIEDGVREWIKTQPGGEDLGLSRTELRLFWMQSRDVWQKKSLSLRDPGPDSQTSLPSTDLESLD